MLDSAPRAVAGTGTVNVKSSERPAPSVGTVNDIVADGAWSAGQAAPPVDVQVYVMPSSA